MDEKKTKFTEQEAPLKNTDKAFVKVSKDNNPAPNPEQGKKDHGEAPARGLKNR